MKFFIDNEYLNVYEEVSLEELEEKRKHLICNEFTIQSLILDKVDENGNMYFYLEERNLNNELF